MTVSPTFAMTFLVAVLQQYRLRRTAGSAQAASLDSLHDAMSASLVPHYTMFQTARRLANYFRITLPPHAASCRLSSLLIQTPATHQMTTERPLFMTLAPRRRSRLHRFGDSPTIFVLTATSSQDLTDCLICSNSALLFELLSSLGYWPIL